MLHDGLLLLSPGLKLAIAGILLLAAGHDIMTRTVPNWMPLSLGVLSAALAAAEFRLPWGLGFGLTVFALCFIFWWRGWMGGGDVKLLGATAIVIAPAAAGSFLLAVSLSGGILAMAYLAGRVLLPRPARQRATMQRPTGRRPTMQRPTLQRPTLQRPTGLLPRVLRVEAWRIRHHAPLPYACAIAAGTIFVLS